MKLCFINPTNKRERRVYELTLIVGSDAHIGFEIGKGRTIANSEIEEASKKEETKIEGEESNYYLVHGLSVAMEKIKGTAGR